LQAVVPGCFDVIEEVNAYNSDESDKGAKIEVPSEHDETYFNISNV
jgi:hypothetical protein